MDRNSDVDELTVESPGYNMPLAVWCVDDAVRVEIVRARAAEILTPTSNMNIKRSVTAVAAGILLAGCQAGPANSGDSGSSGDRTEYLASVRDDMKAMDAKINDLAEKSKSLKDDAKTQADNALATLREERAVLGEKYDQLSKSSQDAWASAKAGFTSAWSDMQTSFADAKSKFN